MPKKYTEWGENIYNFYKWKLGIVGISRFSSYRLFWACGLYKGSSALIDITGYIFGNTEEEIINDFWENIETRIGYDLPFVDEAAIDYLGADNYQQAITNLIEMIKLYKIALWEPKSYAIYDLYGSDPIIAGSNNTRF